MLDGVLYRCIDGKAEAVSEGNYKAVLSDNSPKRTFDLKSMLSSLEFEINNVVFDSTLAAYLLVIISLGCVGLKMQKQEQ